MFACGHLDRLRWVVNASSDFFCPFDPTLAGPVAEPVDRDPDLRRRIGSRDHPALTWGYGRHLGLVGLVGRACYLLGKFGDACSLYAVKGEPCVVQPPPEVIIEKLCTGFCTALNRLFNICRGRVR